MFTENKYEINMPDEEAIYEATYFYREYVNIFFKLNFVFKEVIRFILKNNLGDEE